MKFCTQIHQDKDKKTQQKFRRTIDHVPGGESMSADICL